MRSLLPQGVIVYEISHTFETPKELKETMTLPDFQPTATFIENVQLPCLIATASESTLPGLGHRHEDSKGGKIPGFKIYLRCRVAQEISTWHRKWLKELFEEETILAAIRSAMATYQEEWCDGEEGANESDQDKMKTILSCLVVVEVILDDVTREIFVVLDTYEDGNLEEHGITIYRKKRKWCLGYADVISTYIQELDLDPATHRKERKDVIVTDPSFLYGKWVFDEEATSALWRAKGYTQDGLKGYRNYAEEYSPGCWKVYHPSGQIFESVLVGCELRGSRLTLTAKDKKERVSEYRLKYDGERISGDFVVRRESPPASTS